jgi:hypothetical protein
MSKTAIFTVPLIIFSTIVIILLVTSPISSTLKISAQNTSSVINDILHRINETKEALKKQDNTSVLMHLTQLERYLTNITINTNGTANTLSPNSASFPTNFTNTNIKIQKNITLQENLPTNTIQLNVKEKKGVYTWTNKDGTNPNLNFKLTANNLIQIKNPTNTIHRLIVTLEGREVSSSGDISSGKSGKLVSTPVSAAENLEYYCQYHPTTMKGRIIISP